MLCTNPARIERESMVGEPQPNSLVPIGVAIKFPSVDWAELPRMLAVGQTAISGLARISVGTKNSSLASGMTIPATEPFPYAINTPTATASFVRTDVQPVDQRKYGECRVGPLNRRSFLRWPSTQTSAGRAHSGVDWNSSLPSLEWQQSAPPLRSTREVCSGLRPVQMR